MFGEKFLESSIERVFLSKQKEMRHCTVFLLEVFPVNHRWGWCDSGEGI
jgi:hypothetical protein